MKTLFPQSSHSRNAQAGSLRFASEMIAAALLVVTVVVASPPAAPLDQNPAPLPPMHSGTSTASELEVDLQRLKERRFRELKYRIDILSEQWQRTTPSHSSGQNPLDELPQATVNSTLGPLNLELVNPDSLDLNESNPLTIQSEAGEQSHAAQTTPVTAELPELPATIDGAIDRFALATSLFGTGEWELCLNVLHRLDIAALSPDDRMWAEYLQACCHRRLGHIGEAQKIYRRLLSEPNPGWIGEMARWWLDNLDDKTRLMSDVQRLSATLAAWEKEIEKHASRTD